MWRILEPALAGVDQIEDARSREFHKTQQLSISRQHPAESKDTENRLFRGIVRDRLEDIGIGRSLVLCFQILVKREPA